MKSFTLSYEFGETFHSSFDEGETLPLIRFERTGKDEYCITFSGELKQKAFRRFYGDGFEDWTEGQMGQLITKEEWKTLPRDPMI